MGEWLKVGPPGRRAYLAEPQGGSGPGVLVLHAWWGLTSTITDVCDALASEGYVALAPDLFRDEATATTIAVAEALVASDDNNSDEAEQTVTAALDQLRGLPSVAGAPVVVMGYSLGAYWALDISQTRPDDIKAVVVFYGTDGGDYSTASAAYLCHFAEHDDFEPLESVQAIEEKIRAAGLDLTLHVYPGTGHWFVEPDRTDAYDAEAAQLAWQRTLAFLNDQLA